MTQIDHNVPVVLITGANRGIGLSFIKAFLDNKHPIKDIPNNAYIVATCRDCNECGELKSLQESNAQRLHVLELDLGCKKSCANFLDSFNNCGFQRIDVLINNAGIYHPKDGLIDQLDVDVYNESHLVNAIGPVCLTLKLLPILNATHEMKGGKIGEQPQRTTSTTGGIMSIKSTMTEGQHTDQKDDARMKEHPPSSGHTEKPTSTQGDDMTKVRIMFVTSSMGSIASCDDARGFAYRTSKASLNMMAKMFSNRYPHFGVIIQHPGWVATDMGGEQAPLQPEDSVRGCIDALNTHCFATQSCNKMWSVDGSCLPW